MTHCFETKTDQQSADRIGNTASEAPKIRKTTDIYLSSRDDWQDIDKHLLDAYSPGDGDAEGCEIYSDDVSVLRNTALGCHSRARR